MQPFKTGMLVSKSDFCGRRQEIKYLKEHILSNDRVYIYGERRTGKTSLVFEAISKIKKKKCLLIDLLGIKTSDDLARRMIKSIVSFNQKNILFLNKILKQFSSLCPNISIDPLTNMPTIGLTQAPSFSPDDVESIFDMLNKIKNIVVFFDKFQDIITLDDYNKNSAIMRSKIQKMVNTPFIFAGSIRNAMIDIFACEPSPFYKSAFPLNLGPLEEKTFIKYLQEKFLSGKRKIKENILSEVITICGKIPGDIQRFCASLWEVSSYGDNITLDIFPKAFETIFALELPVYERILYETSSQQIKCLTALARLGGESSLSQVLIAESGITLAGSVNKALNRLVEKRILQKKEKYYKFCNPFFKSWLLIKNI